MVREVHDAVCGFQGRRVAALQKENETLRAENDSLREQVERLSAGLLKL